MKLDKQGKKDLGSFIRLHRLKADLWQYKIAELIGANRHSISNWERGVELVPPKFYKALAGVFGLSDDAFAKGLAEITRKQVLRDLRG